MKHVSHRMAGMWIIAVLACGVAHAVAAGPGQRSVLKADTANVLAGPSRWVTAPSKLHGSGVVLMYITPPAAQPGETANVSLKLSNIVAPAGAQLVVRAGDPTMKISVPGATDAEGTGDRLITLASGEMRELTVQVSSAAIGRHYLSVFTTQQGRVSAASVPVLVGTAQARPQSTVQGVLQTTRTGESIVSLPSSR